MSKIVITHQEAQKQGVVLRLNNKAKLKTGKIESTKFFISWDKIGALLFENYSEDLEEIIKLRSELPEPPDVKTAGEVKTAEQIIAHLDPMVHKHVVIKAMEEYAQQFKEQAVNELENEVKRLQASLLDVSRKAVEQSQSSIKSEGSEWISVDKKLHENLKMTEFVLVKINGDVSPMLHYFDNGLWFHYGANFHTNGITEWKRVI